MNSCKECNSLFVDDEGICPNCGLDNECNRITSGIMIVVGLSAIIWVVTGWIIKVIYNL